MPTTSKTPTMLVIMDGWGIGDPAATDNAVAVGATPVLDDLAARYPHTQLLCSGEAVGLPEGQMGNSEVGHTNIGAGRVVYQELTRITRAIRDGSFYENAPLNGVITSALEKGGALHLFGLVSPGGVHSHSDHLYALLRLAKQRGVPCWVHAFLDGRDVGPSTAAGFLMELTQQMKDIGAGRIATISGRFYAMDRDKRWDRVQKAYAAIAWAQGNRVDYAARAIRDSYDAGVTDEFVVPVVIDGYQGMNPNDSVIFFNFRPDRARELTHAFTDAKFDGFEREETLRPAFATMTQYEAGLDVNVAYPPEPLTNTLGAIIEQRGLTQLRIAETEKYAHVTFFLNGGVEQPYTGEDRILVPSPKVATYDLQPEMSALEVTDKVVEAIRSRRYDFIILNYANGDMVGHTGVMAAAVKAVETVDACVGRCVDAVRSVGGVLCVTADHGNAEQMLDRATGQPFTQHTTNPVPFILVDERKPALREGCLADIAPTLLKLANIAQPGEMTGQPLF